MEKLLIRLVIAGLAALAVACAQDPAPLQPTAAPADALADANSAAETAAEIAEVVAPLPACNGSPLLCDRPLDQVAFAAAHNAMSAADAGWALPNHPHGMIQQLEDGIRAFLIDLHTYDVEDGVMPMGETALCHGYCVLGAEKWSDAATKINTWLTVHPREVLVFIIEDAVAVAKIQEGLGAGGLLPRVYAHPPGQGWPTLNQLIAQEKRVVVMTQSSPKPNAPAWQHGYHDVLFDNPYAAEKVGDFSCEVLRGSSTHALALLNHFLTKGLESHQTLSAVANTQAELGAHAEKCRKQWGRQINFVAVDWYTTGAVLNVVRQLNGLPN